MEQIFSAKLKKWGDSLAVILPSTIRNDIQAKVGDSVVIKLEVAKKKIAYYCRRDNYMFFHDDKSPLVCEVCGKADEIDTVVEQM